MPILKAYAFPHPPLAVPAVGKGQESGIQKTLAAFDEAAAEIAARAPETVIFITPHNVLYADYFHISPGESATGSLARFGATDVRLEVEYDTDLIAEITRLAEDSNIPAGTLGEKEPGLDHGITVPMWFIGQRYQDYKAVIVSDGHRRGLLLPNLDGIDTVKEQVAIARKKGGIHQSAPVNLERFEVVRHE